MFAWAVYGAALALLRDEQAAAGPSLIIIESFVLKDGIKAVPQVEPSGRSEP